MAGTINFFNGDISFRLKQKRAIRKWIASVILKAGSDFTEISFIFCSDKYLLKMNRDYLNHDYLTDIITFSNGTKASVGGDIYISIDRVKENAHLFHVTFDDELGRVMIHGILHMLGYKDKRRKEVELMRKMENKMLALR